MIINLGALVALCFCVHDGVVTDTELIDRFLSTLISGDYYGADDQYQLIVKRGLERRAAHRILDALAVENGPAIFANGWHYLNAAERKSAVPVLLARLGRGNSEIKQSIIECLGSVPESAVASAGLLGVLNDKDHKVRAAAAYYLGDMTASVDTVVVALRRTLTDKNRLVRVSAARSLCVHRSCKKEWTEIVISGLEDEEARYESLRAILTLRIHSGEAIRRVIGILDGKTKRGELETVIYIVRSAGDKAADGVPRLIPLIASLDDGISAAAASALAELREASIQPLVTFCSKCEDERTLRRCLAVFSNMGRDGRAGTAFLSQLLTDQRPNVRMAAAAALERIWGEEE